MEILTILAVGTLCIVCFFVGAKVGQTVSKGEEIKLPDIPTPMQIVREHQDKKEAEAEQNKIDTIVHNIEHYNGTSIGQKDVPKG